MHVLYTTNSVLHEDDDRLFSRTKPLLSRKPNTWCVRNLDSRCSVVQAFKVSLH